MKHDTTGSQCSFSVKSAAFRDVQGLPGEIGRILHRLCDAVTITAPPLAKGRLHQETTSRMPPARKSGGGSLEIHGILRTHSPSVL